MLFAYPHDPQISQVLCRMIYNMCTQKPPHDYSEQLYNRYRDAFTRYIVEKVFSCTNPSDKSLKRC